MKAFLLAAGHGTRLRPLTDDLPKCLLPIQGVPILEIWIEVCRRYGIDEVLINLHAHSDLVRQFVVNRTHEIKVQVAEEKVLLGSAGTLVTNKDWVQSEELFWVFYADVLNQVNLGSMLKLHRERSPIATLGAYRVPDPSRCGILNVSDDGTVSEFVEKPLQPKSNLAFSGLLIASPQLIETIPPKLPVDLGYDVFPQLAGKMVIYPVTEYLLDIGTLHNYQLAQVTWPGLAHG